MRSRITAPFFSFLQMRAFSQTVIQRSESPFFASVTVWTPLYVPTATWSDLRSIDLLARSPLPPDRVFLYFHKLRLSAGRREALRALARRQPHLHLLGASAEIADRLRG